MVRNVCAEMTFRFGTDSDVPQQKFEINLRYVRSRVKNEPGPSRKGREPTRRMLYNTGSSRLVYLVDCGLLLAVGYSAVEDQRREDMFTRLSRTATRGLVHIDCFRQHCGGTQSRRICTHVHVLPVWHSQQY